MNWSDQFATRNTLADCVREALIDWPIIVWQLQIFEHACLALRASFLVRALLTWARASDNRTCMHLEDASIIELSYIIVSKFIILRG